MAAGQARSSRGQCGGQRAEGPRELGETGLRLEFGAIPLACRARKGLQDPWPGLGQAEGESRSRPGAWGVADEDAHQRHGRSVSPQETGIPEELLVTVVRPGLPTLADLHVLLPPPRPTRKRSLASDKVPPAATRRGASRPTEGLAAGGSARSLSLGPRQPVRRGSWPPPRVTTPSGALLAFTVPVVGGGWGPGQAHLPRGTHATSSPVSPAGAGHRALTSRPQQGL